jgi:hypothetical protein
MKYTVNKGNPNEYVLIKNGIQSVCPFTQPFPMPVGDNQVNIMRIPCTTQCPHANFISVDDTAGIWEITCTGVKERFIVESPEEKPEPIQMRSV